MAVIFDRFGGFQTASSRRNALDKLAADGLRADLRLDGQITDLLSSPFCKNISVFCRPKSPAYSPPSRPSEGRIAIVTDAGWDAVDAEVPLTNGTEADGEDVWS
jgi:hypothetical protein